MTSVAVDPAALEERFLEGLRHRVGWQADAAARLRGGFETPAPARDVLELRTLRRLVDGRPDAPRHREWSAFLDELEELKDAEGRLPSQFEGLIAVVLEELL